MIESPWNQSGRISTQATNSTILSPPRSRDALVHPKWQHLPAKTLPPNSFTKYGRH